MIFQFTTTSAALTLQRHSGASLTNSKTSMHGVIYRPATIYHSYHSQGPAYTRNKNVAYLLVTIHSVSSPQNFNDHPIVWSRFPSTGKVYGGSLLGILLGYC